MILIAMLLSVAILFCFSEIRLHKKSRIPAEILVAMDNKVTEGEIYAEENEDKDHFAAYSSINKDVAYVLCLEDDDIPRVIPVVYTPDDYDKYFRLDLYKQYDSMGTVFVDDNSSLESFHLILNGHSSLTKDTHFTFLKKYADENYFTMHPYFQLESAEGVETYFVIGFYEIDLEKEKEPYLGFYQGEIDLKEVMEEMKPYVLQSRSYHSDTNRLLTLITCNMQKKDSRYLLIAERVEVEHE